MMNVEIATNLIDSLAKHLCLFPVDKEKFVKLLMSVKFEPTSKFRIELPDDENYSQIFQETTDKYYCLSIRRILINKNVNYETKVPFLKKVLNAVSGIGWSSNVFSRKLRLNKQISNLILESDCPFSLLGKLQTYDFYDNSEKFFRISRPILVLANKDLREKIDIISNWENENIIYEQEVGFLFRYFKKISHRWYFAYS